MNFALEPVVRQGNLRVAIITADPLRKATLTGIVAGAGHCVTSDFGAADIVISDETTAVPAHSNVIRLGDTGDGMTAGVLPRNATTQQIEAAIHAVSAGLSVRARNKVGFDAPAEPGPQCLLTSREMEVLGALIEGLSNKSIARKLEISQHTVKFHVESLFRKLEVNSRSQAVIKGLALISQNRIEV
jgi:DNA-binding CsgD family transcriptional regulator